MERREEGRTPNIWRRSGSRKRKGMLETWRRFGVTLPSAESSVPDTPEPLAETHWPSAWGDPSDNCRGGDEEGERERDEA